MPQSALFKKSPSWMTFDHSCHWSRTEALNSWLKEKKSLTQRLRKTWANVSVSVLLEKEQRPFIKESQWLCVSTQRYHLVREVVLLSNNTPLILARTVIPPTSFKIAQGNLTRLGTKPLGEVLFADKRLKRQLLAFSLIQATQWTQAHQIDNPIQSPVWGRATRYSMDNQPIIVSEFFLPALFETP